MEPDDRCEACVSDAAGATEATITELEPYEPSPVVVRLEIAKAMIAGDFSGSFEQFAAALLDISETVLSGAVPDEPRTPPPSP